jgi:2-methylcitrate dehydratase PrpD
MQRLSGYLAGALKRRLPEEVVERTKVHLVDMFAAMLSGSRLLPGKRAITHVRTLGGTREAGVIGTRIVTTAINAALANGMCGHADETDATHTPTRTHPGTSVIPAALAIAEQQQLSGELMLRAVVLGHDVCARTLYALDAAQLNRAGHHPGAIGQLFGAAAAAAALLKLDAQKMRYTLAYAGEQTAGLCTMFRDTQHIEKAYAMGGMPAHNGVAAALMVAHGFTGVEDLYSGERDFFFTYAPQADREALVRGLGHDFEIMRTGIKRWCAGGPIQAPLHVLLELIQQHGIKAADVVKLVVRLPGMELRSVNNRDMPDISIQHLLAVMLLDGTVTFASAHDFARMKDPAVRRLRSRIEAIADETIPNAVRGWRCVMEVTLKDGRKLTHQTMAAKGCPENPLTRSEIEEKALDLMAPVLGKQRSRALVAALLKIDACRNVRALRRLYAT